MLDHGYFPRNPDGTLKTRERCGGCGWKWGFHVCLAGKPDLFPSLLGELKQKNRINRINNLGFRAREGSHSEEHLEALREGSRQRWAKHHAKNADRDARIVTRYKEGQVGYLKIAEEFGISGDVCYRILKQAEENGEITMRKPGRSIRNGAA